MPDQIALVAPVSAVTVFPDGARVLRSGEVRLAPGLGVVVAGGLPATADPASVRVAVGGGTAALLDVEARREFSADPLRGEIARLRSEAERWRDAVQELDDEAAAEQARLGFAGHLAQAAAAAMARAVSAGRAGHADLSAMADHLSASTAAALGRLREITARKRSAQRELDAAERRLADAEKRPGPAQRLEIRATIEAREPTSARVDLSYHVADASWQPLYDIALSGERLAVGYLAEVTQRTGEDWPEAELTLSTTRRGAHQALPELRPWYIGRPARPAPSPPVGAMPRIMPGGPPAGAAPERTLTARTSRAPVVPETAGAPLTTERGESGASVTYRVTRPVAVPSGGAPRTTTIARFDLHAAVSHLTVPALAAEAYLRATVTNSSPWLLLPGRARLFSDGQFTGETTLATVAPGEEFELRLGVDDQVRIERRLLRRQVSKAVLGAIRTIDMAHEISVSNHRNGPATVTVRDHIPVSTDGDIKVRLRETSRAPAEQTDLGELSWTRSLAPGRSGVIRHRFTVEHPAAVTVAGL